MVLSHQIDKRSVYRNEDGSQLWLSDFLSLQVGVLDVFFLVNFDPAGRKCLAFSARMLRYFQRIIFEARNRCHSWTIHLDKRFAIQDQRIGRNHGQIRFLRKLAQRNQYQNQFAHSLVGCVKNVWTQHITRENVR